MTTAGGSDEALQGDLDRLAALDQANLRRRWRAMFGRTAPPEMPRAVLVRVLAYRLQAERLGDLDRASLSALAAFRKGNGANPVPSSEPGTVLIREWQGDTHYVSVLDGGFAWGGEVFGSLSAVARAITGTRWNGRRFFGVAGEAERSAIRTSALDQRRAG